MALRLVSRSEFDHIGLLIREENKVFVLESISGSGILVHELEDPLLINWSFAFKRICFRRFVCDRSQVTQEGIMKAVNGWAGLPYSMELRQGRFAEEKEVNELIMHIYTCLLYTSPSPRDS